MQRQVLFTQIANGCGLVAEAMCRVRAASASTFFIASARPAAASIPGSSLKAARQ